MKTLFATVALALVTTASHLWAQAPNCPNPPKPKDAQEALMMEQSSNKEGCWQRASSGQLVFVNKGGIQYKPVLPQPKSASLSGGIAVKYVPGDTGIEILSPWSTRGRGPSWSVAVFSQCSDSPWEENGRYVSHENLRYYGVDGPAETLVAGAEIVEVGAGTHCVLVNAVGRGKSTGWLAKTGQYTNANYVSGYGFRPFNVEVKVGYTAVVSVPMGVLNIQVVPPSPNGVGCTFVDSSGYNLTISEGTGETDALAPGSYSYSCGGTEHDYNFQPSSSSASLKSGTVQISSGQVSPITLAPRPAR